MATRSALRTRLQYRLGLGVVSAVEQSRLNEALNSGIARAISDGVPGLTHDIVTGSVLGDLSLTSAVTASGSSTITIAGADLTAAAVYPRDIVVIDVGGTKTKFLVRDVINTTTLDIGLIATSALSGGSDSKIIRRSLILPSTGQVYASYRFNSGGKTVKLEYDPRYTLYSPYDVGTPKYFEQRYSRRTSESYLSLWPAPSDATTSFLVVQGRFEDQLDDDTDELKFPEEALDAILERARLAYLTWTGSDSVGATLATQAVQDSSDSLKNSANTVQIHTKQ